MNAALIRKFKIRGTIPNGVVKNLDYINTPALVNLDVFTRATTATMLDQDAIVRYAASGQVRMQGQRVVANIIGSVSENLNSGAWVSSGTGSKTATTITFTSSNYSIFQIVPPAVNGMKLVISFEAWGSVVPVFFETVDGTDGSDSIGVTLTLTATRTRYSFVADYTASATISAGNLSFYINRFSGVAAGSVINFTNLQVENVTGQTNQNPASYVSKGVLAAPWQGAGIDGTQYFSTINGNTVAANVVAEATGAAISGTVQQGYLAELPATNSALWSRDMTNAAWVKTNATAALTSVGMDGAANSASRLTATAANGTILQTLTAAAVARTYSYGVRRITGTGNIQITQDGAAWTTVTTTGAYTLVQLTATQLNPVFGIRIVTSGDAIDVDFNQLELGNAATSSIPTTTVAVPRNADVLYVNSAGVFSVLQPYTIMAQVAGVMSVSGTQALCGSDVNYMAQMALVTSGANATFTNDNGTLSATKAFVSLSASTKYVGRKGAVNQDVFIGGAIGTASAIGTPVSEITKLYIGCHNGLNQLNGVVQKLKIVRSALTDIQVTAL